MKNKYSIAKIVYDFDGNISHEIITNKCFNSIVRAKNHLKKIINSAIVSCATESDGVVKIFNVEFYIVDNTIGA